MVARIRLLPRAEIDIDEAFAWYADHAGLEIATRFYLATFSTLDGLVQNPDVGSRRWQWESA